MSMNSVLDVLKEIYYVERHRIHHRYYVQRFQEEILMTYLVLHCINSCHFKIKFNFF